MDFSKIGFIGLGLIGGSIAKTIKCLYPDTELIATAGHLDTITEAYKDHTIANDSLLTLSAFADCDVIFLCCPVKQNLIYLEELKDILRKDCIITDVGSVKGDIHREVIALGLEEWRSSNDRFRKNRICQCHGYSFKRRTLYLNPYSQNQCTNIGGIPKVYCFSWC